MSQKKNRPLPPRRLRMNRAKRLQSARRWLETQAGRTPVQMAKSYRKWFGVDWPCAIQELGILGIHLDSDWVAQLNRSLECSQKARREQAGRREGQTANSDPDSNEYFAYIAGYTSGGAPFGITWEEWRQLEAEECQSQDPKCPF
jgi:hypothetical protein